jgi:hypothetical protein
MPCLLRPAAVVRRAVLLAVLLIAAAGSTAHADELDDLRRENARLKAEVQSLQAQLDAARAAGGRDGAAPAAAPGGGAAGAAGTRLESVYIPRTRVSLEVGRDAANGATTLATLWYRTADGGPLPRKEWFQLRADQMPDGALQGPWLLVERQGAGAAAKVEAGTLTVDGKTITLPVVDYDTKRRNQTLGPITSASRDERIRFSLPASALPLVASARTARFTAGGIDFTLTDEHLSAFAAMAARVAPASAPAPAAR